VQLLEPALDVHPFAVVESPPQHAVQLRLVVVPLP